MFRTWITGAVAAVVVAASSAANAYVIDFTSAATGTTGSLFNGAVTWTMTSNGVLNNSQSFDGNSAPAGTGLSFTTDGYGVGANDDEITTTAQRQEWIDVTFSAPVLIDALYFLDLFRSRDGSSLEIGVGSINGGSPIITLAATAIAGSGAAGFVGAMFEPIYATVVRFTVLSGNDGYGFADGALAGIGIAPIPVPAAGMMLLGGLGGLVALRRRKKA